MIFYIKDENEKLYGTCKVNENNRTLVLDKSSFIKKTFDCVGCDSVTILRQRLLNENKLDDHNNEVYLLNESVEFEDIDTAVCLVLGGRLRNAKKIIQNEFGESFLKYYSEVFK